MIMQSINLLLVIICVFDDGLNVALWQTDLSTMHSLNLIKQKYCNFFLYRAKQTGLEYTRMDLVILEWQKPKL